MALIDLSNYDRFYGFKFNAHGAQSSDAAKEWTIVIWARNAPDYYERPLGSAPVLRRTDSGRILPSSLEWDAECQVDGEFSQLYTCSPKAYPVTLEDNTSTVHWAGWIVPELYSAPYRNPPYDVHLVASDNLTELKRSPFAVTARDSLANHLRTILDEAGYSSQLSDIYVRSTLTESGAFSLWDCYAQLCDGDTESAPTYWDMLERILAISGASLFQHDGVWLVMADEKMSSDEQIYRTLDFESLAIVPVSKSYNFAPIAKQANHSWLPDGYLTDAIEPARKSVQMTAPFVGPKNIVTVDTALSADWSDDYGAWWIRSNYPPALVVAKSANLVTGYTPYEVKIVLTPYAFNPNGDVSTDKVKIHLTLSTSGGKYYNFNKLRWQNSAPLVKYVELDCNAWDSSDTEALPEAQTVTLQVQYMAAGAATLSLILDSYDSDTEFGIFVHEISLSPVMSFDGWRNTYALNNGAREEADGVELAAVDYPSTLRSNWENCVPNGLSKAAVVTNYNRTSSWSHTGTGATGSLVNVSAMIQCAAVGLPRIRRTGTLMTAATTRITPPLVVSDKNINGTPYIIRAFEWNILESTLSIEAYTLPSATVSAVTASEKKIKNRLK